MVFSPALVRDLDRPLASDLAGAGKGRDLVFLEQIVDAIDIALDALVLVGLHGSQIELWLCHLDAHFGQTVGGFMKLFRRVQQGFGGDAADIQAGATMAGLALTHSFFDNSNAHAQLRGADRTIHIATRAGSDNDKIKFVHGGIHVFILNPPHPGPLPDGERVRVRGAKYRSL